MKNYSNRSASIGFILAARLAGDEPKIIPIKIEQITEMIIARIEGVVSRVMLSATSAANVFSMYFAIKPKA